VSSVTRPFRPRTTRASRQRALLWLAETVAPKPDPTASPEDAQQFCHHDLSAMTVTALELEQQRTRLRLALDPQGDAWFSDRLHVVELELACRRLGATRQDLAAREEARQ
jgi:hypothetical protein